MTPENERSDWVDQSKKGFITGSTAYFGSYYARLRRNAWRNWNRFEQGKLTTLKAAAEQANTALANGEISQSQYDALQREIIETEQDLKRLEEQANQSATAANFESSMVVK